MLKLINISKTYVTGSFIQHALKDINISFRDNEFVSILGSSGSGKTTLLNIIGGLDRYDTGDLVINSISTKKYRDCDWNSYRNHTIGFVFQNYNLIPHQSVLSNVELAMTISGICKKERLERAKKALNEVGLSEHIYKKPNQISGGQMQRVAIARALVNNPDILLADEPTGALDSITSVQIMELLKRVAKDRLVIMVTHNPDIAEKYSSRIVNLSDGKIINDTDPYYVEENDDIHNKSMGKSFMSFFTALSLSFNNLKSKKARTVLTAFAGSIGIIGIALIMALSNGVSKYIDDIQRDTMMSYPIVIDAETVDIDSMMKEDKSKYNKQGHDDNGIYSDSSSIDVSNYLMSGVVKNNLSKLKKYIEDPNNDINKHLGGNGISYSYDLNIKLYGENSNGEMVSAENNDSILDTGKDLIGVAGIMKNKMMQSYSGDFFRELASGRNGEMVSDSIKNKYDMLSGKWPEKYDEVILILNNKNEVPITLLYSLGLISAEDYEKITGPSSGDISIKSNIYHFNYDELLDKNLYLISKSRMYDKDKDGTYNVVHDYEIKPLDFKDKCIKLKICGVVKASNKEASSSRGYVGYTGELTDYIIKYIDDSEIVKNQEQNPDINILNGMKFEPFDDAEKIKDAKEYIARMGESKKLKLMMGLSKLSGLKSNEVFSRSDEDKVGKVINDYLKEPDEKMLLMFYNKYISPGSYDDNMKTFGYVDKEYPSSITIYPGTYEDKDYITKFIEKYNESSEEEDKIAYTDFIGMITSSVVKIVNVVSYILIAFVAVSLVVSSIMIGIITYISVLERTKEIGILRAIGASKQNISQVFIAETVIVGFLSGVLGIIISQIILVPINGIIHRALNIYTINAFLKARGAVSLIILSTFLTLIGGIIPAVKAARKDPVSSLRSE